MKTESEERLTKYLLGDLPEAEQLEIEEAYFADKEFYEQLIALQNELLYDYTRGNLSPDVAKRFEQRFLSSSPGREQAETARAILDKILELRRARHQPPEVTSKRKTLTEFLSSLFGFRFPVLMYSGAVAALALLIGCAWLFVETVSLRGQLNAARVEATAREQALNQRAADERGRMDQLNRELERERQTLAQTEQELAAIKAESANRQANRGSLLGVISLVLNPGMVRGGEAPKQIRLGPETGSLRLQLNLKEQIPYASCRAVLRTLEGREVWHGGSLRTPPVASGQAVRLSIPARLLEPGDYELTLSGVTTDGKIEDISNYYFNVSKR